MKSRTTLQMALVIGALLTTGLNPVLAEEQTTRERVLHHRAMEATIWALPMMNYEFYRDALIEAGVGPNNVGYYSKLQDWKFQTATSNNTTPYILAHWTMKNGQSQQSECLNLNEV